MIKRALRAENIKESGIMDSRVPSLSSSALYYGSGLIKNSGGLNSGAGAASALPSKEEEEDVSSIITLCMLHCISLNQ